MTTQYTEEFKKDTVKYWEEGWNSWKNWIPSSRQQQKNQIKNKICDIYEESSSAWVCAIE